MRNVQLAEVVFTQMPLVLRDHVTHSIFNQDGIIKFQKCKKYIKIT